MSPMIASDKTSATSIDMSRVAALDAACTKLEDQLLQRLQGRGFFICHFEEVSRPQIEIEGALRHVVHAVLAPRDSRGGVRIEDVFHPDRWSVCDQYNNFARLDWVQRDANAGGFLTEDEFFEDFRSSLDSFLFEFSSYVPGHCYQLPMKLVMPSPMSDENFKHFKDPDHDARLKNEAKQQAERAEIAARRRALEDEAFSRAREGRLDHRQFSTYGRQHRPAQPKDLRAALPYTIQFDKGARVELLALEQEEGSSTLLGTVYCGHHSEVLILPSSDSRPNIWSGDHSLTGKFTVKWTRRGGFNHQRSPVRNLQFSEGFDPLR